MTAAGLGRRGALAGALALALTGTGAGAAGAADDMALGARGAPVTVIEYASLGCPHCAVWAKEVFPAFKRKYIDTGKVRFVFREMLFGDSALAAAGFLTARCAGPGRYFQVVDAVFAAQEKIAGEGGPAGTLQRIAKDAGVSQARFKACLENRAALTALQARTDGYARQGGITGTPTFVVGGRKLEGHQSLAQLDAAIAAARRR